MTRDYDDRDFQSNNEETARVEDRHEPGSEDIGREEERAEQESGGEPAGGDDRRGRGGRGRGRGGDRDNREPRERIDNFEKMKVWQEAHQLCLKVFAATPKLPAEQQAGLALQVEQAAVGVPKSIAEGFKRRGPRNKAHFYNIAQSSLEGLRYYFILCRDLKYDIDYEDLSYRGDQVARMLDGLVRSMLR